MATYYNPKIITNNIEFSVDAANVKSWSGATSLGTDYGYMAGGYPGEISSVDRIDYSNDTATASARGPLTGGRKYITATGNTSYGYWMGGKDASPAITSTIQRLDYSSDTTVAAKGPLSTAAYRSHAAVTNNTYGYHAGGDAPSTSSKVQRIEYANDTATAVDKGPLTGNRYLLSGTGNQSYGYWAGGSPPFQNLSVVDRIDYSSDTSTAAPKGNLEQGRRKLSATGNASYGYVGGGTNPGYTLISRIDYSSDTSTAVAKGPISVSRSNLGATGNTSYGYWMGGSSKSTIDRLDYSSDTTAAAVKGPLNSTSFNSGAAASSKECALPSSESVWKDMTGRGHDATVDGATYQGGNIGVWNFDGTNDEITLSATTDIQAQAVDWTWESWFYIDSGASSYDYLFAYGPPHQIAWYNNQLNGWFNDTDSTSSYDVSLASGSNTVPTGQWTHGVISRIGSAWKMYINGVEKASATATFTVANSSTGPRIGSYDGSQYFLDGKIASMRIYKGRGFTASEVLNNFNATRARFGV